MFAARGDVFVFASSTETQGLVLLEAMALGVPVVSTAAMGTRDILASGRGALVADENVDDFVDKVVDILQDESLHNRLSIEARIYVGNWTSDRMASKMSGFYASVTGG